MTNLKYPTRVVRFKYQIDNPLAKEKPKVQTAVGLIKGGGQTTLSNETGMFLTIWNRDRGRFGQSFRQLESTVLGKSVTQPLRPNFYQKSQIIGEVEILPLHEELIWRIENDV